MFSKLQQSFLYILIESSSSHLIWLIFPFSLLHTSTGSHQSRLITNYIQPEVGCSRSHIVWIFPAWPLFMAHCFSEQGETRGSSRDKLGFSDPFVFRGGGEGRSPQGDWCTTFTLSFDVLLTNVTIITISGGSKGCWDWVGHYGASLDDSFRRSSKVVSLLLPDSPAL